jgi:hypothetical protein
MKVIIAGGRDFNDYNKLCEVCDSFLSGEQEIEIVSGVAKGADKLGEQYAKDKGYYVRRFPANWNKYKKSAGAIRNGEMATYADCLIAFWDGQSRGTKNMIDTATKKGLKIKICNYTKNQ